MDSRSNAEVADSEQSWYMPVVFMSDVHPDVILRQTAHRGDFFFHQVYANDDWLILNCFFFFFFCSQIFILCSFRNKINLQ